jgi:hypothetical protein
MSTDISTLLRSSTESTENTIDPDYTPTPLVAPFFRASFSKPILGDEEANDCTNNGRSCQKKTLGSMVIGDTADFHTGQRFDPCSNHDTCPGGEESELALLEAAQLRDYAAVAERYATAPNAMFINADRGMLQILDCTGRFVSAQTSIDVAELRSAISERKRLLSWVK